MSYLAAVSPLDYEFVLQHDKVPLALLVLHQHLKSPTKGIEKVPCAGLHGLRREKSNPAQSGNDTGSLGIVGELADRLDMCDEGAGFSFGSVFWVNSDTQLLTSLKRHWHRSPFA